MEISAEVPAPPSTRNIGGLGGGRVDWTLKDLGFGLLWFAILFIIAPIPIVLVLIAVYGDTSGQTYTAEFASSMLADIGLVLVAAHFTFRKYGGGLERLGIRPISRSALLWALGGFIAAFVASLVYGVLIDVLNLDFLKSNCAEQIPRAVRENRALLAFASLAVIGFAPWAEEIFFRGFLFPGFSRAWGVGAGIIVSGLLFGAVHFLYQSFVPIAAVGLVFAFTYSRSRNLLSTMIAHVAFNSLSIALIAGGSCDSSTSSVILGWWPL